MIAVVDPSTEEVLDAVEEAGPAGVDAAVARARAAFGPWAATPLEERLAALERLADALAARQDALGELLAREMGMPLEQARTMQAVLPVAVLRATVAAARVHPWEDPPRDAARGGGAAVGGGGGAARGGGAAVGRDAAVGGGGGAARGGGAAVGGVGGAAAGGGAVRIYREPAGVVAAITPWNFPLHQIAAKLGPALAAGCTVVLKPSELAPLAAGLLPELAREAGLPDGVLELVHGTGPVTGEALVAHPGVDVVTLTGSVRAGRRVGELAGRGLKRVCLELGGKSPSVVLDDADLAAAVGASVERCFLNAGQACNAPTRLLVPAARAAEAEALAAAVADGLVVGPALEAGVTMGPVISAEARERIGDHVEQARRDGARLVAGARSVARERGFFVAPTVFGSVSAGARLAQEEVFGPVLAIQPYADDEDAIALANATAYGLSAEVWSPDLDRAAAVARRLRCGQVKVNGVRTRDTLAAPFGGYGQSGIGRELGAFGLDEFCEVKAVLGAG